MTKFRLADAFVALLLGALLTTAWLHEWKIRDLQRADRMLDQELLKQNGINTDHRIGLSVLEWTLQVQHGRLSWLDDEVIQLEVLADRYRPATLAETEAVFFRAWRTLGHWFYDLVRTWVDPPFPSP